MSGFELKLNRNKRGGLLRPVQTDKTDSRFEPMANPLAGHHQNMGNQASLHFAQSCPLSLPSPSLCPTGGTCHTCPAKIQAKLTISKPDDKYEQEADRVAEQVMSMPEPPIRRQVEPEEEEEGEEPFRAKASDTLTPEVMPDLESHINTHKSGGHPLSPSLRNFFGPRFGTDFSQVRVHTDSRAANTAQAINARAFTSGKDIVFNSGQYSFGTPSGKRLLAHELTHVMQQGKGIRSDTLHRQQNQRNQPQNVLAVESEVQQNIIDANGNVIGMRGTQTVTYRNADGREVAETHNVEWREDVAVEPGQATQYEHPARAEQFDINLGRGTRFPIQTTHTEGGIAIHGPGRSEGCIITGNAIRTDIQNRLNAGERLRGDITTVRDARPAEQQREAPLPQ